MPEHGIAPLRDTQAGEVRREIRETGDFNAAGIVEIAVIIAVAAHAIGGAADLSQDVAEMRIEALPLRGDRFARFTSVTLTQAGNQQRLARFEARRFEVAEEGLIHLDGLHEFEVV